MVKSNKRREVIAGLFELKSLVTTKGSVPHYAKITDTLKSHLQDDDLVYIVWQVMQKMLKMEPEILDPLVPGVISWFKNRSESHHVEAFLSILGELGAANPVWIKNEEAFVKQKLRSKDWNERRSAAFAVGSIGSAQPSFVKDVIPLLIEYASDPEKVRNELDELARKDSDAQQHFNAPLFKDIEISIKISSSMDTEGPTWLRDACIDALGMIGKRSPESVNAAIPLLEKLSKDSPSSYTIKKAIRALDGIRGTK
jgi:HEAT repeat protein